MRKSTKILACAALLLAAFAPCLGAEIPAASADAAAERESAEAAKIIARPDWGKYFGRLNGAAVVCRPSEGICEIYGGEAAFERRSPCSTFKIISLLIALEHGIITPENSVRKWSGEKFWYEGWNRDINFEEAFKSSCVWYFRGVVDEIGEPIMCAELKRLRYGNCDISDWNGRLNTNDDNPALTGFWIESSLKISPKEQAEVMARIFGPRSEYSQKPLEALKSAMLTAAPDAQGLAVYGKTGLGKDYDTTVDAWFAGFAEGGGEQLFFCVRLGETRGAEATSVKAKEIALKIISEYAK